MWDLIVSVPDHCLSFYLTIYNCKYTSNWWNIKIDFLDQYDVNLNIKKQTLTTCNGKIKLSQQTSNTCACIHLADTTVIPPNTIPLQDQTEHPCIIKESISIAEPTKFLANRGCLIAKTLVNLNDKDVLMSIMNLSDEAVKVSNFCDRYFRGDRRTA